MYLGQIVEVAPTEALFAWPAHPYTRALLASIPSADPDAPAAPAPLGGEPPPTFDLPGGCRFHPRCPEALERCRSEAPPVYDLGGGHTARCWLHAEAVPRLDA
jgi:oligopeptide/dipeptide ABC transporter ATP-binding protein